MLMSSSVPGSEQTRLDRQMGLSGRELERPAEALTACWLYHHRDVLRVLYAISLHQERVIARTGTFDRREGPKISTGTGETWSPSPYGTLS